MKPPDGERVATAGALWEHGPTTMHGEAASRFADLPRLLAAAPHRLLFFAGVCAVMLSMGWWTVVLAGQRFGFAALPPPPLPAGWGHAVGMQYHVLALFIFGFLLTVFPRWMGQEPFPLRAYVPIAGAVFAGYLLTLAGLVWDARVVVAGLALTLAGWTLGLAALAAVLWRDGGRTYHALSCWAALALGGIGLCGFLAFAREGNALYAFGSIKAGTFAFLLPMFVTVCHRMLPFFAQSVLPGYRPYRPGWWLAAFWALAFSHLLLELGHAYAWLWPVDAALAGLTGWLWWRWQPWRARPVRLLWVLFAAFAWLPLAFALYAAQSAWFAATGDFALGRGPVHALTVGYFGSMLVAMVTRVTQGHSGRPLEMGAVAWFAFVAVQIVATLRVVAELLPDAPLWQFVAALGWLVAFAPWAARSAWIYLTPRTDGKPG